MSLEDNMDTYTAWDGMDLNAMDMEDMDDPIREIEEYSRMPIDETHEHPYVIMRGEEIDQEMAETIQTLWDAGITTAYCCQGDIALGDHAYIAFASPADLAMAVSMIVDHEVSIEDGNVIRYRGSLRLQAPGQPVTLPDLPMGDIRVLYEDEDGMVTTHQDNLTCVCHVVGGEIRDAALVETIYNPMICTAREIRENHERELKRFAYPWCVG